MDERDTFDILKLVTDYLNNNNIPYMTVGGVALGYYGNPRTTLDIDILLILEESKIIGFINFLEKKDFQVDEYEIKMAFKEKSHFTILDKKSVFRIDVKGIYDNFDRESFNRRKKIHFRGFDIYINTAEDAVISKLIFGSLRDLNDAEGILLRQENNLDLNYLKKQAHKHNILNKLNRLLRKCRL